MARSVPKQLQRLTQADCTRIFGQDPAGNVAVDELMGLFARALGDLGRYVEARFGGSFRALVEAAEGRAERLVSILAEMPFYQDVGFYKRAQLTAADLSVAHVATFSDLDRLTIFADNLVPHVLRVDGILEYAPGLLERIEREGADPVWLGRRARDPRLRAPRGRADRFGAAPTRRTRDVDAAGLRAVEPRPGAEPTKARPRHRTRTVFY